MHFLFISSWITITTKDFAPTQARSYTKTQQNEDQDPITNCHKKENQQVIPLRIVAGGDFIGATDSLITWYFPDLPHRKIGAQVFILQQPLKFSKWQACYRYNQRQMMVLSDRAKLSQTDISKAYRDRMQSYPELLKGCFSSKLGLKSFACLPLHTILLWQDG